jgi:hypothetical protein
MVDTIMRNLMRHNAGRGLAANLTTADITSVSSRYKNARQQKGKCEVLHHGLDLPS